MHFFASAGECIFLCHKKSSSQIRLEICIKNAPYFAIYKIRSVIYEIYMLKEVHNSDFLPFAYIIALIYFS